MTEAAKEPPEPPELRDRDESDENPRYVEEWRNGEYVLTGRVAGRGLRRVQVFFGIVLSCAGCVGAYLFFALLDSSSTTAAIALGLMASGAVVGGVLFLATKPQTVFVKIGPDRTTIDYRPNRWMPPRIDERTEDIIDFVTKERYVPGVNGGTNAILYLRTRVALREVRLYHEALETALSGRARDRLNWALARVRRLIESAKSETPPQRQEPRGPYRD